MRKWFLLLLLPLMLGCSKICKQCPKDTAITVDTIYVEKVLRNTAYIAELEQEILRLRSVIDSLDTTMSYENYINARRIEKIKYYINITENNSNNKKFFYGWIKRTMTED